ncbi:unnamed protein product [Polarella glacialis]|uniref:Uncharacterized protein n=1 Tax=Polarella glacialis TaxID=89957 RepID=A0A813HVJ2_POLGL|nr:unnamed protein product [Polarella glacialis]
MPSSVARTRSSHEAAGGSEAAPKALAYRVVGLPHLSMALAMGAIYTVAELEGRCGHRDPARRALLYRKLADRKLFTPSSLKAAVRIKTASSGKVKKMTKQQLKLDAKKRLGPDGKQLPLWVRRPALEMEKDIERKRRIANKIAASLLQKRIKAGVKVTDEDVVTCLRAWGFVRNEQRKNVLPAGSLSLAPVGKDVNSNYNARRHRDGGNVKIEDLKLPA